MNPLLLDLPTSFSSDRLLLRCYQPGDCAADNLASQRVAERCGFVQEGRFRQHQRKKDGTLVDMLWYGLLREEWQEQ